MGTLPFGPRTWTGATPQSRPITPAYVRVWTPKGATPYQLVILDRWLFHFSTHWQDGRSRPCFASIGRCDGCDAHCSKRHAAYAGAVLRATGGRLVWQASGYSLANCPELARQDGALEGRCVLVQRLHDGPHAPIRASLIAGTYATGCPAPLDTLKVLAGLWGYDRTNVAALAEAGRQAILDWLEGKRRIDA